MSVFTHKEPTNRVWDFLVLWPAVYLVLILIVLPLLGFAFVRLAEVGAEPPQALFVIMPFLFLIHMATVVIIIVDYIYAIHRLYTQTGLEDVEKRTWLILVVLLNMFAIPFLHFMHLRR